MWSDDATLLDIARFAQAAIDFTRASDQATFMADAEKRWAVAAQIIVIGEAVNRLSDDFKSAHSEIPWIKIAGMRNRIVHGYDKINWAEVWETVKSDIPNLLSFLKPLLPVPPDQP